jgi:hypothetical protein
MKYAFVYMLQLNLLLLSIIFVSSVNLKLKQLNYRDQYEQVN